MRHSGRNGKCKPGVCVVAGNAPRECRPPCKNATTAAAAAKRREDDEDDAAAAARCWRKAENKNSHSLNLKSSSRGKKILPQ